ncbi:MAG: hypothetical protein M1839_003267 [Geoglossum umbratile]|nr:MAG: hypothetical protein M1839_003267 [Geoglossum umbratile]
MRRRYRIIKVDPDRSKGSEHGRELEGDYKDNPMLHSDSIKPGQLKDKGIPVTASTAELPARELVGSELPVDQDSEKNGRLAHGRAE